MSKIKTIKDLKEDIMYFDFRKETFKHPHYKRKDEEEFKERFTAGTMNIVSVEELKEEAIKWVKEFRHQGNWEEKFIRFFNLTGEDLE